MCRSVATCTPSWGWRAESLQPRPARSYTHTRVEVATSGAIQAAIIGDGFAEPGLEHDRRAAGTGAADVQPVAADVDETTGHGRCRRVAGLAVGLVGAADGREGEGGEHRVEHEDPGPAVQVAA